MNISFILGIIVLFFIFSVFNDVVHNTSRLWDIVLNGGVGDLKFGIYYWKMKIYEIENIFKKRYTHSR